MNLTRTINKTEYLEIKACPNCKTNAHMVISECGYSSFNPGRAQCNFCGIKWDLGFVKDSWSAGVVWNELCTSINKRLELLSCFNVEKRFSLAVKGREQELEEFKEGLKQEILRGN